MVGDAARMGVGFFVLYWVHPYSAIVVLAVLITRPVVELLFERDVNWRKYGRMLAALAVPLVTIGLVGWWQSHDAVFRVAFKENDLAVV